MALPHAALVECGLVPHGVPLAPLPPDADLLPALRQAWKPQRAPSRWGDWVLNQASPHAVLTWSLPTPTLSFPESWFGARLGWWPHGMPSRRWTAFVASRMSRAPLPAQHVIRALRMACGGLPAGEQVLQVHGTTLANLVERLVDTWNVPCVRCRLPSNRLSLQRWLERVAAGKLADADLWVSPPLIAQDKANAWARRPLSDRIQIGLADRIVVLSVRNGGHVEALLQQRARDNGNVGSVLELDGCPRHPPPIPHDNRSGLTVIRRLNLSSVPSQIGCADTDGARQYDADGTSRNTDAGKDDPGQSSSGQSSSAQSSSGQSVSAEGKLSRPLRQPYLLHWTRATDGPWPDQTADEYLDDLLWAMSPDVSSAERSAVAAILRGDIAPRTVDATGTLARICRQQRLLASSRAIRGGHRVVCFSSCRLEDFRHLRCYRNHRRRWDFEPFGIGIARDWLIRRGARRVIYGASETWDSLLPHQQPYFQQSAGDERQPVAAGGAGIDWRIEQEWRVVGDVDLSSLPADAAFLFVPESADPRVLRDVCRWPIVRTA